MKAQIAVFDSHEKAEKALTTLKENNIPLKDVSLLGKADMDGNHLHIKSNSTKSTKNSPAYIGMGAGTIAGLLTGIGIFTIPGFGFLYGAGAFIGAIGGLDLGIVTGGLATVLTRMGLSSEQAERYVNHLKSGNFVLIIDGPEEEVKKAEKILHTQNQHLELTNY